MGEGKRREIRACLHGTWEKGGKKSRIRDKAKLNEQPKPYEEGRLMNFGEKYFRRSLISIPRGNFYSGRVVLNVLREGYLSL